MPTPVRRLLSCSFVALACACTTGPPARAMVDAAVSDAAASDATVSDATPLPPVQEIGACVPSGRGTDYQIGPAPGQLASLELVPWESLRPGDTVRIFPGPGSYKGKILITGKGTPDAPIRVCGVRGAGGARPIIDGKDAVSRPALDFGAAVNQARAIIFIKGWIAGEYKYHPQDIIIDGLEITGQHPRHTFTDTAGATRPYEAFGACIWVDRGHRITLRDNVIHDCTNGIFTKSVDDGFEDGDFAATKDVLIRGNRIYDFGVEGDEHMHGLYVQSVGARYEHNHVGPPRLGALGNTLKDRSVGAVIRYNRLDGGARSIDLVEAEDYPRTALADPRYHTTFVYGNLIHKDGNAGVPIHYGGDDPGAPPGAQWGEPIYRKGTLYFYNNTLVLDGQAWAMSFFQISTTEERAEVWNNIFYYTGPPTYMGLRTGQQVGEGYVTGGVIHLGTNWINSGWLVNDPDHPVAAPVTGAANVLSAPAPPLDPVTLAPGPTASLVLDRGQADPPGASAHPVLEQFTPDLAGKPRTVTGVAIDLGALEVE